MACIPHVYVSHLYCRNRELLAASMYPEVGYLAYFQIFEGANDKYGGLNCTAGLDLRCNG